MKIGELLHSGKKGLIGFLFSKDIYFDGIDEENNQMGKAGDKYCYLQLNISVPQWVPALYFKWRTK